MSLNAVIRWWAVLAIIFALFTCAHAEPAPGPGLRPAVLDAVALGPVVFIPGNTGSQLEGNWTFALDSGPVLAGCPPTSGGWALVWLSVASLANNSACVFSLLELLFDASTNTSANQPGLETRARHFGSTLGVDSLDPDHPERTAYLRVLAEELRAAGAAVAAAAWDFRFWADTLQSGGYHSQLESLIESLVRAHPGRRVTIVAHSAGGPLAAHFLRGRDAAWKAAHVEQLVAIAVPWGGTVEAVRAVVSGSSDHLPLPPLLLRSYQRSREISYAMMPSPAVFGDEPVATLAPTNGRGPPRDYPASSLPALFESLGLGPRAAAVRARSAAAMDISGPSSDPGVPVINFYGTGVPTAARLFWAGAIDAPPEVSTEDGDGVVSTRSAKAIESAGWARLAPSVPISANHMAIVRRPGGEVAAAIVALLRRASPAASVTAGGADRLEL